ncbi:MAG: nucleoside-diphosphate kinase [Candidatus Saganbacteria bacterium]|nr:nucleoside-diphosphate kinase [Candidatus Saganbacteria bacterium]
MAEKEEQTLVIIKPDGLKKSLTGNILTRLSETKLRIVGAKVVHVSRELAEKHYAHLKDKPFFPEVVKYLCGEPYGEEYQRVVALVYMGEGAIAKVRKLAGSTNPEEADSTSIRGQYGRITSSGLFENVVHCSANLPEAEHEIKLWFDPDEIVDDIYPTKEVEVKVKKKIWNKSE